MQRKGESLPCSFMGMREGSWSLMFWRGGQDFVWGEEGCWGVVVFFSLQVENKF